MSTRTLALGPDTRLLVLRVPAGRIEIHAADAFATAGSVELTAADPGDPAAAAAIDAAELSASGVRASVTVRDTPSSLSVDDGAIRFSGGTVVAGNIGGVGNTAVVIGGTGATAATSAGVELTASVAPGTEIRVITTSARVIGRGDLGAVEIVTVSGRVDIESATSVDIDSGTGPVRAHVTISADIHARRGDVDLTHAPDVPARLLRVHSLGRISITEKGQDR
ncbi:hypothetical protein [Nocardia sp. NPDC051750]|uniref:hypothetical protein n=1 Tax=Nocardia sp. NPDC051750 TaxID=3364325 RepID=UPI0037B3DBA9